jgi:hypothetical protein
MKTPIMITGVPEEIRKEHLNTNQNLFDKTAILVRWTGKCFRNLFSYLLTPCSRVLLEKLTGLQLVRKFPAFYGTRRFTTIFKSARHLSLSWASSIQPISSHTNAWRSLLIFFHLHQGLPSGLSLRFPHQNPVHASPLPHTRYMLRPLDSSRFYHSQNIGWDVLIIKLLIM